LPSRDEGRLGNDLAAKCLRVGLSGRWAACPHFLILIRDAEMNTELYECGAEQHDRCIAGGVSMLGSNPLLWPKPPVIWSYGIAVLSVTTALILTHWPALHLQAAVVSLFLCAVVCAAWFGGIGPGLLATTLSAFAFYYHFLPAHSWRTNPEDIPRLVIFTAAALIVASLSAAQGRATESLRRARDDLVGTVQQLQRINKALKAESGERKRAEEKLQRSEAYLSEAQRLSHTGSFGWQVSTNEKVWSDETFRIFGYDRSMKPTVELALQRFHPEDAARVKQTIERAAQDGKDFEYECRLLMPNGSLKHVHVVAHAERDESGELEFVGAVTDTSENKRAEEALRRSESYLAEAQRLTHTGSWVWRVAGGAALHLSEEWYRIYGFDPDKGMPTWEERLRRTHPEDRGKWQGAIERAIREKSAYEVEFRILLPDGTVKHIVTAGHPVLNASGDLVEFVGSSTDITEHKRAEEALRRTEHYLADAQKLTHTGSWVWQVAGGVALHLSEEWFRIYGFDPEKGTSAWEGKVQRIHPEDRDKWQRAIARAIVEKSDYEVELRILLPDGTVKYIHTIGHPVLNGSGDVVQFVGTSMDISASKRAEEAQAELAHVSRVTTMGELTASLAHEVKQPIAASLTNAKTCLRWLAGDTPNIEEARAAAMRIVQDQTRAGEIVSRIRLLFKKGTPEREQVDVNEVVREMIVLLRGETARYSISVRTELAVDLPRVMGDRVQLQQVLMNLMINGVDAMKDADGTRELSIKSERGEDEQVLVSVSDTGVGLPAEHAGQIFQAFFTTKPHGTGMGLRISRSIIESHGGRLWAADNSPRGASFHFNLPITQ
jgi:PAS domain S-box-containing protein